MNNIEILLAVNESSGFFIRNGKAGPLLPAAEIQQQRATAENTSIFYLPKAAAAPARQWASELQSRQLSVTGPFSAIEILNVGIDSQPAGTLVLQTGRQLLVQHILRQGGGSSVVENTFNLFRQPPEEALEQLVQTRYKENATVPAAEVEALPAAQVTELLQALAREKRITERFQLVKGTSVPVTIYRHELETALMDTNTLEGFLQFMTQAPPASEIRYFGVENQQLLAELERKGYGGKVLPVTGLYQQLDQAAVLLWQQQQEEKKQREALQKQQREAEERKRQQAEAEARRKATEEEERRVQESIRIENARIARLAEEKKAKQAAEEQQRKENERLAKQRKRRKTLKKLRNGVILAMLIITGLVLADYYFGEAGRNNSARVESILANRSFRGKFENQSAILKFTRTENPSEANTFLYSINGISGDLSKPRAVTVDFEQNSMQFEKIGTARLSQEPGQLIIESDQSDFNFRFSASL